jgi:hypothetical protein
LSVLTLTCRITLTQAFPLQENLRLQFGLAGYGQWQTTDKKGSTHHFGRNSGTLQGLRSRIRGKRDVSSAEGEHSR